MKKLIAYFIKYPISVNTLLLMVAGFGYVAYTHLTASFFPLVESRIITVQLIYPGASPEEIEEGVVSKIEENLKGVSGVERITSTSNENAGVVIIEVEKGYNTSTALEDIQNAVNGINSFPPEMEKPVVFLKENINFTINYAVTGEKIDLRTLKNYAQKIEDDLMQFEGISKVELAGFPTEEIEIAFNEASLRAYNLTIEQVGTIIKSSNIDITGGTVRTTDEELLIRSKNKGYFAQDFEDIVIKNNGDGSVIRLKEIAKISNKWSDDPNRIYVNGNPGIEVLVSSTDQEDLLKNSEYVRKYFAEFAKRNPQLKTTLIRDQSETLNERKELLFENGLIGILLVLVLLSMFLNIRIAFWVAMGIPVAFLGMFMLALFWGVTINVISLFGMIVVVGILVDDGIVISENVFSHYEMGKSPIRAAIDGTLEVVPAVFSSVVTTMVAFSFFFMVDGRAGDFFSELSFIVIATLGVSLLEAIIMLPSHLAHSKAMKLGDKKKNLLERFSDRLMYIMRDKMYAPVLRFALNHRFFTFVTIISLFIITIGGIKGGLIKFTFFPVVERNDIPINLSMPSGTRESITNARLEQIEEAVKAVNLELKSSGKEKIEIVSTIERKIGPNTHEGALNVILVGSEYRNISALDLSALFRKKLGVLADAEKLTFGQASAFGKPVSITLLSDNQQDLDEAKLLLKSQMSAIPDLKDVVENIQDGRREISIKLKPKAYAMGFNEAQIMAQVRRGFFGFELQRLQRGKDEVKVWVRYDDQQRANIEGLESMRIKNAEGKEIPLSELAQFTVARGVSAINHLDGQKQITIEAELSSAQVSAPVVINGIKENILPKILNRYPSISPLYEGQNREALKTQASAKFALPFVLIMILSIITFTFRSFAQAAIVMFFLVPFSFIGVAWGHFIHGQQLSILSFLGVVALIGIIVNDSLVLIDKMNGFLKEGKSFKDAIFESGYVRFRAIFLTSVTTIAGLAPLILEQSFQAQFLIPMAISVAYGIGVATILTLVLLPVVLSSWNDIKRYMGWAWNAGDMPTAEAVEPAVKELNAERSENEL